MSRVNIPGFVDIDPENPDYYRIEVHGDSAVIFAAPTGSGRPTYPFILRY